MPAVEHARMVRVSKRQSCPICGRPDWCLIAPDGSAAICARMESNTRCGEAGWLHRLDAPVIPPPPPTPRKQRPVASWDAWIAKATRGTLPSQITGLAERLGVSEGSLRRLGACWSAEYWAAAFPMRGSSGEVIGIRLRSDDGKKWAVTGSHAGLFIPDSAVGDQLATLWVCEGPTDCAALLDLGVYAVGRPSCSGGVDLILPLAVGRNLIVMADSDTPKARPDGSTWRPGADGAEALASRCVGKARTVKIVYPLAGKDVREWKRLGATSELLRTVERNTACWRRR